MSEQLIGILGVIGIMLFAVILNRALDYLFKKPTVKVPDIRDIPPMPSRGPMPTIETRYGRDLLEISTKIYLRLNEQSGGSARVNHAVNHAESLLSKVNEHCFKIDREKVKVKKLDEDFKSISKAFEKL